MLASLHKFERYILKGINKYFERKVLNVFFRNITHLGDGPFTISAVTILVLFFKGGIHEAGIASAISLAISYVPVQISKRIYPRKRPYLMVEGTQFPKNPLRDHSFPSGHTTAVFSIIVPFILYMPVLALVLLPIGLCVGTSRMYLGLHYPSDVLAGLTLGTFTSLLSYYWLAPLFY